MSQQKELAYGTAISITAERAIKYYLEMTQIKDRKKFFFSLLLDIKAEEFRAGKFKRKVEGKDKEFFVEDIVHDSLASIAGCDITLREEFQAKIHEYRTAIIKKHEPEELEDLKLDLQKIYDKCFGNDFKIDQDNLRHEVSVFFNFLDLFKVKKSVDISGRIDEAIKQLAGRMDIPQLEEKSEEKD